MRAIVNDNHLLKLLTDGYPTMSPTDGNHNLLNTLSQVSTDLNLGRCFADQEKRGAANTAFFCLQRYVDCLDGLGTIDLLEHIHQRNG
jgi:glutamate carboxypeptidase